ncbi:hypothetical protein NQZ68_007639 [Dissostichus eleginoides]|nr:hypothetical protein NQZ68_007639 [Dissostichus eleginoides]
MRFGRVVDKRNKSEFIICRAPLPATTHPSHHDLAKRSKARHADASRSKLKIGDWTRNECALPADRQTDTAGVWTSCRGVGASSYGADS